MAEAEVCPKCSYPRPLGAVECPSCGIVYAKYRAGAPRRDPSEDRFDPYAPPESDVVGGEPTVYGGGDGVWRAGKVLVMDRGASLPNRCVRCNQPADHRILRKLYWHKPWIYLTFLISLPVYLILALVLRKKAEVEVPLCDAHERARRRMTGVAWVLVLGSIVLGWVSVAQARYGLFWIALLAFVVGLIVSVTATRPVLPSKIDDHYVWLKKVSKRYLEQLPGAPSHLARP